MQHARKEWTRRDIRDLAFVILLVLCLLTLVASKTHAQTLATTACNVYIVAGS